MTDSTSKSATNSKDSFVSNELDAIRTALEEETVDDPTELDSTSENGVKEEANTSKTSPTGFVRPSYIPPHLMGRDLNNPASDVIGTGRRVQKPRLGVKVPYRNLTSQIVTQDEIAQEIFERSLRKFSYTDTPKGGDTFFAMKLTHRLANKINSNDKPSNMRAKKVLEPKKVTLDKILPLTKNNNSENSQNEINKLSKLIEKNDSITEKVEEIFAEISNSITEDSKRKNASDANDSTSSVEIEVNDSQSLDNETLIAILEEGNDLNETNTSEISVSSTSIIAAPPAKSEKLNQSSRKRFKVQLDPNLEKELALQQLQNFPSRRGQRGVPRNSSSTNTNWSGREVEKKLPVKRPCYSLSSVPKRFPKKYQRTIKRQLRISKQKSTSIDQTTLKLPDVPEVQIAIDKYIKTYANKRKLKPSNTETKHDPIIPTAPAAILDELEPEPECSKDPESLETEKSEHEESDEEGEDDEEEEEQEQEPDDDYCPIAQANSKVMREVNRLLADEGAIDMIYSVETKRLLSPKEDKKPTTKRRRNLQLKKNVVKNAVLSLSVSSSQSIPERSRPRRSPPERKKSATPSPNVSTESVSVKTPTKNIPKVVRKVAAEASRIIRRHSSSSAYSSDDDSALGFRNGNQIDESLNLTVLTESRPSEETTKQNKISNEINVDVLKTELVHENKSNGPDQTNGTEKSTFVDLTVMKYESMAQIMLSTPSIKVKNALNVDVLREFTGILKELQKDDECKVVLVTSAGDSFCEGVELESLICNDKIERNIIATKYVNAVLEFTKCLCQFPKLLIAGVNGTAIGLGVTMLPFFDLVYASHKALFSTPYVKLGQIPEAGGLTTLPHFLGHSIANELLFGCRLLTSDDALKYGLVTKILNVENFNEELLPIVEVMANHSAQSMKAIKLLLRQDLNAELEEKLAQEAELLIEQWCSDECQNQFRNYLQ